MSQIPTEKPVKRRAPATKKPSAKKNGKPEPITPVEIVEPDSSSLSNVVIQESHGIIPEPLEELSSPTEFIAITYEGNPSDAQRVIPRTPTLRSGVLANMVAERSSPEVEPLDDRLSADFGKKRGRKPRGGKLIIRPTESLEQMRSVSNVILHLKCSMKDLYEHNAQLNRIVTDPLKYNPDVPPEVVTYNDTSTGFTTFHYGNTENAISSSTQPICDNNVFKPGGIAQCSTCRAAAISPDFDLSSQFDANSQTDNINIKDINAKLKILKVQLYKNAIQLDKKSACFWCTYDFDNIPCHIPKYELDDTIYGYGSFCRPECAVAYLMKENIDDSTKFERYQLLNQIYSKIYGCKKNIKPAPNPYYLLEKYYGNLTIQEYRKLLKTEHLLLVIDKPLTRILPELHEDNEDMIMNVYGINKSTESISGVYKVKRQSEKQQGPSKASIIRSKFGLN